MSKNYIIEFKLIDNAAFFKEILLFWYKS